MGRCKIHTRVHTYLRSHIYRHFNPTALTLYIIYIVIGAVGMGVGAVNAAATGAKSFGEAFAVVGVVLKTLADLADADHYNKKKFPYLKTRCLANRETLWDLQRRLPYSEGSFQLVKELHQ